MRALPYAFAATVNDKNNYDAITLGTTASRSKGAVAYSSFWVPAMYLGLEDA